MTEFLDSGGVSNGIQDRDLQIVSPEVHHLLDFRIKLTWTPQSEVQSQ